MVSELASVLLIDDDPYVLESVSTFLRHHGYSVSAFDDAQQALAGHGWEGADVVLTDINMPEMTGMELLERVRALAPEIPVILMTAYAELNVAINSIKMGAYDFIVKPYQPEYLLHAVDKGVNYRKLVQNEKNYKRVLEDTVQERTRQLDDALSFLKNVNIEIIDRLTTAAEFRDDDTGTHIARIGLYAGKIAEIMNMPADFIESVSFASSLHDIGKIGIPDSILLKNGRLTAYEFEIIKTHTVIGARILSGSSYPVIQMAASVALTHHERWDGTGYPNGLKGEAIPIEGAIVKIVDHYDALRSKRPYKPPFDHRTAFRVITEGDDTTSPEHFRPDLLEAFVEAAPALEEIFDTHLNRNSVTTTLKDLNP